MRRKLFRADTAACADCKKERVVGLVHWFCCCTVAVVVESVAPPAVVVVVVVAVVVAVVLASFPLLKIYLTLSHNP